IPGTGYLALATGAATELGLGSDGTNTTTKTAAVELRDIAFLAPYVVPERSERPVRVIFTPRSKTGRSQTADDPNGTAMRFVIAGAEDDSWYELASGTILT